MKSHVKLAVTAAYAAIFLVLFSTGALTSQAAVESADESAICFEIKQLQERHGKLPG